MKTVLKRGLFILLIILAIISAVYTYKWLFKPIRVVHECNIEKIKDELSPFIERESHYIKYSLDKYCKDCGELTENNIYILKYNICTECDKHSNSKYCRELLGY